MFFFVVVALVIALDQSTKWYTRQVLSLGESYPVIQDVFHFTYIENQGAAFGILPGKKMFFVILTFVVLAGLLYLYRHMPKTPLLTIAVGAICAGAIGNVIDRLQKGTVTDMLDFRFWPVFNVADIAIVCGFALLFYYTMRWQKDE